MIEYTNISEEEYVKLSEKHNRNKIMANFGTFVHKITGPVENHPNADRLSIIRIKGNVCIANKLENGSPRYKQGDYVAYIQENSVIPEWLLRDMDCWDEEKNIGKLAGSKGNRVKALRLRGVYSEGLLYPVKDNLHIEGNGKSLIVEEGQDVSEFLSIEKYEPEIPTHMNGEVLNLHSYTKKYDFESILNVPDIFDENDHIVITEKLHGTFCNIGIIPGLLNQECFGESHSIFVTSKGLGAKGLAFKNNEANNGNIYVRTLKDALENGLEDKIQDLINEMKNIKEIHIFGEIFGNGIQDLHYGQRKPSFRIFDIMINNEFLSPDDCSSLATRLGFDMVPKLYMGLFSMNKLFEYCSGKDTISNSHIREGIVIHSSGYHPLHGRKIAKLVSEDYKLRKNKNATEFA